jgi:predicted dehydrogenase
MTERLLGVGIIGAGWVAGEYVKAVASDPRTVLRGITSRTAGNGTRLLGELGSAGREYPTYEELLADDGVDIVVSCTTPDVRQDHVCAAAESGRHVVIEKPVALTMADVQAQRRAIATAGVKSVTSFVLRWHPQLVTTRQLVADGVVGELSYAEAAYWNPVERSSGPSYDWHVGRTFANTALVGGGCHAVDAIRFLTGQEIVQVSAVGAAGRRNTDFVFPPTVAATARFANGAVGTISTVLDADTPYRFSTRLVGDNGTIQNRQVHSSTAYPGIETYWTMPTSTPDSGDVAHHPFAAEISHLVDCIETDTESHASIHDTCRSMAVCFAIDQSVANGGVPVTVP